MKIHVFLAGPLSKYGNGSRQQMLDLNDFCQLKDLLVALEIPEGKYSFALINGIKSLEDVDLKDGDEVKIYPMVSGG